MIKSLIKKIIILTLISISILQFQVFADSNGIWHFPSDIKGGIFGFDEQDISGTNYTFINNVYFKPNTGKGIEIIANDDAISATTNTEYKSAVYGFANNQNAYSGFFEGGNFIILSGNVGIGIINPTTKLDINGDIRIRNKPNCTGRLYTDSQGNILCGIDSINDSDSEIGNEYPIAGNGITVFERTVSVNPPLCSGTNKALQWTGTTWACTTISVSSGGVTCTTGYTWNGVQCICTSYSCQDHSCFVKGTKVSMADNSLKNIEDIVVGDKLIGNNSRINTVIELDRTIVGNRNTYIINNNAEVTGDHPFLTVEGWKVPDLDLKKKILNLMNKTEELKDFNQLGIGDKLIRGDNSTEIIWSIKISTIRPHNEIVYNLNLDGDDTYIAANYVVHNCN